MIPFGFFGLAHFWFLRRRKFAPVRSGNLGVPKGFNDCRDDPHGKSSFMDSAQHCQDHSAECLRLVKLAQSEAEAHALKNLSRTWTGLAGQIDRYNALKREQGRRVAKK
jgi:hypothetical protein